MCTLAQWSMLKLVDELPNITSIDGNNMPTYNEKLFRVWVISTPRLYEHYKKFVEDNTMNSKDDPYGQLALKMVFFQVVLQDCGLRHEYETQLRYHETIPDADLIALLTEQLSRVGWNRFFVAVRLCVHGLYKHNPSNTVNRRRLDKSLELLEQLPKHVDLK